MAPRLRRPWPQLPPRKPAGAAGPKANPSLVRPLRTPVPPCRRADVHQAKSLSLPRAPGTRVDCHPHMAATTLCDPPPPEPGKREDIKNWGQGPRAEGAPRSAGTHVKPRPHPGHTLGLTAGARPPSRTRAAQETLGARTGIRWGTEARDAPPGRWGRLGPRVVLGPGGLGPGRLGPGDGRSVGGGSWRSSDLGGLGPEAQS